jgi:glyoxylase-like metal-dependent hydrolase (beta-lactamase superfamily II)
MVDNEEKNGRIFVLTVTFFDEDGEPDAIYPAVISDVPECGEKAEKILVDCGYPGFLPKLEDAAQRAGFGLEEITSVVITHHDHDHYGALREFLEKYPHVRTIASELDAPYIDGRKKSLRLAQAEAIYPTLPDSERTEARMFQETLAMVAPARMDATVRDGDRFPWCGGTEIIATPGHMPGHISLYVRKHRTLITGDALVARNGRLRIANPSYAMNAADARASVRKLALLDVKRFICFHGGIIDSGQGAA